MDQLGLVNAHRPAGAGRHERSFYDFTVNGKPLRSRMPRHDHIGVFGWLPRAVERAFARQLLRREPSTLPSGRAALYVCPECSDFGCGVLGVDVSFRDDDCVVWTDIGWDDPSGGNRPIVDGPRDFWFDRTAYVTLLSGFT